MSNTIETSVIIIGGSIVGLATSAFLAHRKVPHIMIERHTGSSPHPRAVGYTMRTVELMRMLGLDDQIPQVGMGGKPRRVQVESLAGKWADETHWTADGKAAADAASKRQGPQAGGKSDAINTVSPVGNAALSQDKIEPILRMKAQELGADHRLGWKMTAWSQDENGVSVTAVDKEGQEIHVHGQYLIAADGPKSIIRESIGIRRQGVGYMRTLRSMLFNCNSMKKYLTKGFHQFTIKNGDFEAFMTTYPDGRWALMTYNTDHSALDDAGQRDLIRKAAGEDIPDSDIELLAHGTWDLSALISNCFQEDRVFFAGDSAHTLPPTRGGYGANTGIADGHDLAWKLQAVLSGESTKYLLDTYDGERRPVALVRHEQVFVRADYKDYLQKSTWKFPSDTPVYDDIAMELGQFYRSPIILGPDESTIPAAQTPEQWAGQPGTRAAHFWATRSSDSKRISILDTLYNGYVILSEDQRWRETAQEAAKQTGVRCECVLMGSDVVEEGQGAFRRLYGVDQSGAVLVRPDGYIAWRTETAPEDQTAVFKHVLERVALVPKKD